VNFWGRELWGMKLAVAVSLAVARAAGRHHNAAQPSQLHNPPDQPSPHSPTKTINHPSPHQIHPTQNRFSVGVMIYQLFAHKTPEWVEFEHKRSEGTFNEVGG
jgi:hypothetical protein